MSDLDSFLESQAGGGTHHSEGMFTLSLLAAREKFSQNQLPHPGAWALKLIQAAVAGGQARSIRVSQGRKSQTFLFSAPSHWQPTMIWELFEHPQYDPGYRDLAHLRVALWVIGIQQRRPFEIRFEGEPSSLVWTGETLLYRTLPEAAPSFSLTFRHQPADEQWTRFEFSRNSAFRNSDVSQALVDGAFTCPVPLTLDGRRLDALALCPSQGHGPFSQPVLIGGAKADLPSFPLPPGTFERLRPVDEAEANRVDTVVKIESTGEFQLAFLVSLHVGPKNQGRSLSWESRTAHSYVNWICDGIVVHQEKLPLPRRMASLGFFLNADGLETDLTTMGLRQTPERFARYESATRTVGEVLEHHTEVCIAQLVERSVQDELKVASLMFFGGLVTLPILPMSLGLFYLGYSFYRRGGKKAETVVLKALDELKTLPEAWRAAF